MANIKYTQINSIFGRIWIDDEERFDVVEFSFCHRAGNKPEVSIKFIADAIQIEAIEDTEGEKTSYDPAAVVNY